MAAEIKFKKGDLVKHRAGGPVMAVDGVHPDGSLRCTWFAGSKHQEADFAPETLVPYVEEPKK